MTDPARASRAASGTVPAAAPAWIVPELRSVFSDPPARGSFTYLPWEERPACGCGHRAQHHARVAGRSDLGYVGPCERRGCGCQVRSRAADRILDPSQAFRQQARNSNPAVGNPPVFLGGGIRFTGG